MIDAVIISIVLILCMYIIYYKTSQGLENVDYRVMCTSLLPIFIICLYAIQNSEYQAYAFSSLYLLLIMSVIPGVFYLDNKSTAKRLSKRPFVVIDSRHDILWIGYYILVVFFSHEILLELSWHWMAVVVNVILLMLPTVISAFQLGHYFIYGVGINAAAMLSIQATRRRECLEFLKYKYKESLLLLISLGLIFFIQIYFVWQNSMIVSRPQNNEVLILCLILLFCIYSSYRSGKKVVLFARWRDVKAYRKEERLYKSEAVNRLAKMEVSVSEQKPKNMILIIGESAGRDKMHYYNREYKYLNTPWLESLQGNKQFIIFNNVYAPNNVTPEVLKLALTEMSQYNNIDFKDAVSLIEVAKKCGYKTHWFSHQGRLGQENTVGTMIASEADEINAPLDIRECGYDKDLLKLIKNIDANESNFIVVHIMGSHAYYQSRYPKGFGIWPSDNLESSYANSILYTDEFLHELFDIANERLSLDIMFYFSDHGENIPLGHGEAVRSFDTVRIPMFTYLSQGYIESNRDKYTNLLEKQDVFFTTDMLYNTLMGLMTAYGNCYNALEDLTSREFKYKLDDLKTFSGKENVKNDPDISGGIHG